MEKFLKNKKIGKKLQLSFGSIITIFVVTIAIAVVCITLINNKMKDFYERPYVTAVLQMEIRKDVQYVGKQLLWAMTTDDMEETKSHVAEVESYSEQVGANVEKLSSISKNKELMEQLSDAVAALKTQRVAVAELTALNKNDEALVIYNSDYDKATVNLQNVLMEVGNYADEVAEESFQSAQALGRVGTILMFVIGIVCVLFCIYLGMLITKSIQKPIIELEAAAKKLSNGELDAEISYASKDELGGLADNFRTALTFMKVIISDTGYLLGEISKGNFLVRSKNEENYVGDFSGILNSTKTLVDNLDGTLKQINEGASQVAIGASQMADSAQSLAEGATEQAGAIEELTATIENVSIMATESADNAKDAAERTSSAAKEAQDGQRSMQELVTAMENISNVSMEIQNIIGAIEDIASQTNLLSLNASIEAARAGEAGKGFAVVADQIGKLASDSAQSAIETKELISKSLVEIESGNTITQMTVSILENIITSMGSFADMAKASWDSSTSQADMLHQIQDGIEQIASVVQNNSATAEESSATSEELSAQSDNLKSLVGEFQLSDS